VLITKNSIYLHLPKTGGTWVNHVLTPIAIEQRSHHIPTDVVEHDNVFCFVRNPWDWYVTLYQFFHHGSSSFNGEHNFFLSETHPVLLALFKDITFEDFIIELNYPNKKFKERFSKILNLQKKIFENSGKI